jgi:hypothetical protein
VFFLPLLFIFAVSFTFSQETELINDDRIASETSESVPLPDDDLLYVISGFEFEIKGRTRPFALLYKTEFKTGDKIQGKKNLDKYIADKTQILINQRVLKDNAVITSSVGEQMEDGSYPVTLTIKVEDSWNIVAIPRPQYSTNSGFDLTIKARDYNFLGTMNPLRVDIGYRYDENSRSSFQFEVYSDTPFKAFDYAWNFKFNNLFSYRPQVDEPYFYQNITGISLEVPFHTTTFTFGFDEYFTLNQENSYRYKEIYHEEFQRGLYMTSRMHASWEIPTGITVSRYGELTYTPGISATFNHEFPDWPLLPFRKGPFTGFSHSLKFGRIDWIENYRDGLSASFYNSYTFDFFRLANDQAPVSLSYSLNGQGHFIISKFFGISSRIMYRHWFYHNPAYYEQAGDALRGISDKTICADYMLSLNMDFPFRVLLFTPSRWFNNRKFSLFDLEFHVSPVIDMALYHDPKMEISFNPKNIAVTGGLELIVFSSFMRSLYIRLCYAVNMKEFAATGKLPNGDNREISLLMGHFY